MDQYGHDTSVDHDFFLQGEEGDYPHPQQASSEDQVHPSDPSVGGAASSSSAPVSTSAGAKRSRRSTSAVWQDFEKVMREEDGVQVRYAKCNTCKHEYTAKSSGGTGHLLRHAATCKKKAGVAMRQTMLHYNPDGSVHHWEYNTDNACKELCRFVARADLPLNISESPVFEDYIQ